MKRYLIAMITVSVVFGMTTVYYIIANILSHKYSEMVIGSLLGLFWCFLLYAFYMDYKKLNKTKQDNNLESTVKAIIVDDKSSETIYTQLGSLTKDEILWLHEHVENQKVGLIEVNGSRRESLIQVANMFSETKGFEHLYDDAKKELDAWDEFYVEQSTMVAKVLPKLELLKDAVS